MRTIALAALALLAASTAHADSTDGLTVPIDQVRILRIPRAAGSVVIGNPSIADITIHDARTLVLTGRTYGVTNLVVLDTEGEVMLDDSVMVSSNERGSLRVYRQASRETYSCSPICERKLAIGDNDQIYDDTFDQINQHETLAKQAN